MACEQSELSPHRDSHTTMARDGEYTVSLDKQLPELNYESCPYFVFKYEGLVKIVDVYDGDTCTIIFPYLNQLCKYRVRLLGVDCPELPTATGPLARNHFLSLILNREIDSDPSLSRNEIRQLLGLHKNLNWCETKTFDKYGRLLVNLHKDDQPDSPLINDLLIEHGHAKPYM